MRSVRPSPDSFAGFGESAPAVRSILDESSSAAASVAVGSST